MNNASYTTTFTVDQTPEEAFTAINNVHRSTQKITELVPGRRVAWHVVDGYLSFVEDKTEWTGTDITFDISPAGDQTQVRFTHAGLVPEGECFDSCSSAWGCGHRCRLDAHPRASSRHRSRKGSRLGLTAPDLTAHDLLPLRQLSQML
jgi:hypothetical protein